MRRWHPVVWAGLLSAVAAFACGLVREGFWPVPERDAGSHLLAFQHGSRWRVVAGEAGGATRILNPPDDATLYFLTFDEALSDLGLSRGELAPEVLVAREDCRLARPKEVLSRPLHGAPEWLPSEVPASLGTTVAPAPACVRCASFEVTRDVPPARVHAATWLDSGAALLLVGDGSLVRAVPGALATIAPCARRLTSFRGFAGNELWVATSSGIGRVRIDETALECIDGDWFPQPAGRGTILAVGAAALEGPIWVLTSSGSLERLEGEDLIEVAAIDMSDARGDPYRVVPHGDGVLVSVGNLTLHRFENGRLFTDVIPPASPTTTQILSLASVPPRALFGTNSGHLHAREAGPWSIIFSTPGDGDIHAIVPFRHGVLLATDVGAIELPEWGPACPTVELSGNRGEERAMIARDDLVLLPQFFGSDLVTDERPILWLRRL